MALLPLAAIVDLRLLRYFSRLAAVLRRFFFFSPLFAIFFIRQPRGSLSLFAAALLQRQRARYDI